MKFKNGKVEKALPNGLGDNTAYFDGTTSAEIVELDTLPINGDGVDIVCSFYLEEYMPIGGYQAIFSYGGITSSTRSSVTMCYGWDEDRNQYSLFVMYNNKTPISTFRKVEKGVWNLVRFYYTHSTNNYSSINVWLNDKGTGSHIEVLNYSGKYFNAKTRELSIGKQNTVTSPKCVNFKGNIKNFKIRKHAYSTDILNLPLHAGQDDETLFKSKSFVYDTAIRETSSGFNSLGKPIRYRSASQAGIEYSPIDIPKDGLVFYADYKNGKDRVTKTVGECSNVTFEKHNGCDCAYFNGVDSSILWKNILTSDLQYYTIFTKFAVLPKEHWGMIFGLSPENNRGQGYSIKTYRNIQHYCNHGNDYGGADLSYDTWGVSALVGYGEWIELYHNGTVYVGHSATSIPANSWLYNGIDFGYNADPQQYYGYIAESIVYNRTFSKEELQTLTQQLLNKGA